MKQVIVNGLVVYTGPPRDAYGVAANFLRQMAMTLDWPSRRLQLARKADLVESADRLFHDQVAHEGTVIRIVEADIRHLVPECGHELFADGACRGVQCPRYFLKNMSARERKAS